jgi:hypothetical protein
MEGCSVRRTIIIIAGALLLQLSLLSAAQASTDKDLSSVVNDVLSAVNGSTPPTEPTDPSTPPTEPTEPDPTTPDPTDPTEPDPTDPTTPDPTEPDPTEPDPTDPTTTEPEPPEFGSMSIEPTSGRPGTVIQVNSITPSRLEGEQFALMGLFPDDSNEPLTVVSVEVAEDGSWGGSLIVPRGTEPGDYFVVAEAFTVDGGIEGPSFPYAAQSFEVTPAPIRPGVRPPASAPPAGDTPVVKVPSLTG